MSTTTYSSPYGPLSLGTAAPKRGLFGRFIDRLVESRMRKAESFIQRHSHLIPRELEEQAAWKITDRSENSLPFVR